MGTLSSKDTRRISFDNQFALSGIVAVPNAIENESLINFENISTESGGDVIHESKPVEIFEVNENDYWTHRIENLKKEHQVINKIIETEYDKQLEKTRKIYTAPKVTHERLQKFKPCFDWRSKIVKCYEANPRQPLACSTAVQSFTKCVAKCRGDESEL